MPGHDHDAELDDLLTESPESAAERARTAFDRLAGGPDRPMVLFGAGNLGRRVAARLRELGRPPVALADNSPAKWGTTLDGVPVLSPTDAAERFRNDAAFVCTIWGAGQADRHTVFLDQLRGLGCRHVASVGHLFWANPAAFLPTMAMDLPQHVLADADAVRAGFDRLADDRSRAEFVAQIRWRLHLDFDALGEPIPGPDYFPADLVRLGPEEVFIDCGAFTGDTVASVLAAARGRLRRLVAFEADPVNAAALTRFVDSLPPVLRERVDVRPEAVGAARGTVRIEPTGTAASVVGSGSVEVECVPLDEGPAGLSPTYIKMDIEGAEPEALAGAAATIRRCRPRLAVCVYHAQNHLWRLPLQIAAIDPTLRLYLRPHGRNGYDLVCYALPAAPPC